MGPAELPLAAAVVVWTGRMLIVTTRLAAIPRGGANSWFTPLVYRFASVICHQRPERSFVLWQTQMPVCARCTGIYVGALLATVALWQADRLAGRRAVATPLASDVVRCCTGAHAALTLAWEWTTGTVPSNAWRAAAGVPLGLAVTVVIGALLLTASASAVQSS